MTGWVRWLLAVLAVLVWMAVLGFVYAAIWVEGPNSQRWLGTAFATFWVAVVVSVIAVGAWS